MVYILLNTVDLYDILTGNIVAFSSYFNQFFLNYRIDFLFSMLTKQSIG